MFDRSLPGHNSESVIDLINHRILENTTFYDDGRRLALIVEGGGMRGVLSAGSLFALDLLGCRNVFDEVYAVSSGGVNAAYFLSGQGELGISVYFDDISSPRFINPLRFWKIIDVDYVYDHIVTNVKTLNEKAIRNSRPEFFLGVTDADSGRNLLIDVKDSPYCIARILKASSAIPVFYNRTVGLGERKYVDGGLSDLLPIAQAAANKCTDVLVLTTRFATHVSKQPALWERLVFFVMMGWLYPETARAYKTNFERSRQSRAYTAGTQIIEGTNVATICPTREELVVGLGTMNRATLIDSARKMALRTGNALGKPLHEIELAFERLLHTTET